METAIIAKLTISNMKVIPQKHIDISKAVAIAQVYGKATGIKPVVDKDRGEIFNSIVGQFEGVNLETGAVYQSGVLYLPSGIHAMVESAADKLAKDSTETVDFALEIRVVKSTNKAGYSYEAVNLIQAKVVDPLEEMRKVFAAKRNAQLETPKEEAHAGTTGVAEPTKQAAPEGKVVGKATEAVKK